MTEPAAATELERFRDDRGTRWIAEPDFSAALRETVLPALDELLQDPPGPSWARLVKKSHYRRVVRLELEGGAVFLKAHAIGHFGRRIGQRLFGTRGENEWEKTRLLRALGIATPRPLAAGAVQQGFGLARSYYVSAEVPSPRTLTAALADERSSAVRHRWLAALGEDLSALHRARLHHRDLHGNNAMISPGSLRPVLLDLHSLWRVPLLPPWSKMRSIAKLLASLDSELEPGEDAVFLRAYLGARAQGPELEQLLARARRRARAVRDEQWRSRVHRALTGGSKIVRERGELGRTWRVPEVAPGAAEAWFRTALAERGARVLKDEAERRKVVRLAAEVGEIVVKLDLERGISARLRAVLGRTRARRAWLAAHGAKLRKIGAPAPLALLEVDGGPTLFAMRVLPPGATLETYAREEAARLAPAERRELLCELARFLARVHDRGGHHADLSAKNAIVHRDAGAFSFSLVDLEDFRLGAPPRERELVRALGQLNDVPPRAFSVRERLRFWVVYRRARALPRHRAEERAKLRAVDAFTRARVERRELRWRAEGLSGFETGYFAVSSRSTAS